MATVTSYTKAKIDALLAAINTTLGTKVDAAAAAAAAPVQSVNGQTGAVTVTGGGSATTDASLLTSGILAPARIGDASIVVGKLSTAVQTSLGKADTALQTIPDGSITAAKVAADVATQAELDAAVATLVPQHIGNASGDTTGATDTATIQTALTSARVAGGGLVQGKVGQTYLINAPLQIGTGTVLDMTGCTIRLVAGSNCLMLANYSSLNPVGTGMLAVGSGQTTWTIQNTSDVFYTSAQSGMTFDVPMTHGTVTAARYVGTVAANGVNTATRQFNADRPAPTTIPYTAARLYNRDTRILVRGGIWDRQNNGSGDTETNHVMRFRGVDGLIVENPTFLSTEFSAGRYAMLVQNVTTASISDVTYGLNPNQGTWLGTPGYARDGVHITGPSRDILVRGIYGFPGDDMVAITSMDFAGVAGEYAGDVTNCTFEDIYPIKAGASAVKIMGGPTTTVARINVRNVYGSTGGSGGAVWIGDDNRQASTTGGIIDQILIENLSTFPGNTRPLITFQGVNIGRVILRNLNYDYSAGTAPLLAVGTNITGSGAQPTVVRSLDVTNLNVKAMGASQLAVFAESGSSITTLVTRGWDVPRDEATLISGTVTNYQPSGAGGGAALAVQDEGTPLNTAATAINFVGSGVTATGTGSTKTVTIPGGGALSVQDEGSAVASRATLNFVGAGVTVTDDAANSRAVVTIPGGGGSVADRMAIASFLPVPATGEFFGSPFILGGASSQGTGVGRMFFVPFVVSQDMTIAGISVHCPTAVASSTARLGLYAASADGRPTTLIVDGGVVDCSTTGDKEVVVNQSVTAGMFFVAVVGQGTAPTLRCTSVPHGWAVPTTTADRVSLNNTASRLVQLSVSGALPASATAVVSEFGSAGGGIPVAALRRG